jgi:predicted GTPase
MLVKMEENHDAPSMVVIMGVTGAGKSYFINQLAGKEVVQEGSNLDSCKQLHLYGLRSF